MSNGKIAVMGSFIVDLMALTPRLPKKGETVRGTTFKAGPGGKGSNQGVASNRSGVYTTMITRVGKDDFGDMAIQNFKNEGMSTEYIYIDPDNPTGTALIMVDETTGENRIVVTPGACDFFSREEIERAGRIIADSDIFLTQLETNFDAVEIALNIAYESGTPVILNPAPAHSIPDNLLQKIDILTPNETEAGVLTGIEVHSVEDAEKAGKELISRGTKNVIITMGKSGSLVITETEKRFIEPSEVIAVDTTGAGDAYNGGLAASLAEGNDIFRAAEFASVVGALSVTKIGTAPAMPLRDEIDRFMKDKYSK